MVFMNKPWEHLITINVKSKLLPTDEFSSKVCIQEYFYKSPCWFYFQVSYNLELVFSDKTCQTLEWLHEH